MEVLYFAIQPPLAARAEIVAFTTHYRRVNGLTGRPRPPSLLHISIFGIGQYPTAPRAVIDRVSRIAETVALPAFDVEFDTVETLGRRDPTRPNPHALTGDDGVIGVHMLRDDLGPRLEAADYRAPTLRPHVTIHYDRGIVAETGIRPIRWRVEDFVLIRSLHGQSRHEVIGRWALGAERRSAA